MAHRTVTTPPRRAAQGAPAAPGFPGCRPVRISREEIADCERRLEYWDAATEIAKTRGLPVSAALPRRLAELTSVSAEALVQAALECRGEEDLLRLAAYPR